MSRSKKTVINLNDCFPEPYEAGIRRGPLPKQQLFLDKTLWDKNTKYVRYVGGIGSGKTLIGCITIIAMATMHGGDYLIARQFMPELRDTTYKTFLELCPPELIVEHRVADAIVRLRSSDGKIANILFRPLEEPDKMRSLNLNAFYIDEANQVSEAAFTLLQGRLRGRYFRKGIITQNSGGHDWSWRWFVKKDMIKKQAVKNMFLNIVAPSTENVHLPEGYVETMLNTWSDERIQREIYANEDSFEGMVFSEFRQDVHVIQPFKIPDDWTRVIGVDHGYRNPAAWIWIAVDGDQNIYVYREFYEKEWDIEEICKGKRDKRTGQRLKNKPGVIRLNAGEKMETIAIDPSVRAKRGHRTEYQEYLDNLPSFWPITLANNKKEAGIDKLRQYMKINANTQKPKIFIFSSCINVIEEVINYRYQELPLAQQGKKSEKEEPLKLNDHAIDALRYAVMTQPEPNEKVGDWYTKTGFAYHSLEGRAHRELMVLRGEAEPDTDFEEQDPFQDNI